MNTKILTGIGILGIFCIALISGCIGGGDDKTEPAGEPAPSGEAPAPSEPATTTAADDITWCAEGNYDFSGFGAKGDYKAKVEKQTVGGKVIDMCCVEYSSEASGTKSDGKGCYDKTGKTQWHEYKTYMNGEFQPAMSGKLETWEEGDKLCTKQTDGDGKVLAESCVKIR